MTDAAYYEAIAQLLVAFAALLVSTVAVGHLDDK